MEKQIQLAIESLLRDKARIEERVKESDPYGNSIPSLIQLEQIKFALQILVQIKNNEYE